MKYKLINGYRIYATLDIDDFLKNIINEKKILIAMNANKIILNDNSFRNLVNNNIGYTDGIAAVMALKQKGLKSIKVAGANLWLEIIKKYRHKKTFFIIGSTDFVIEKTVKKLKKDFPNINIVGYRNGYFNAEEEDTIINNVKEKNPDIIFVALGSPRQEIFMEKLIEQHSALYMGLGGSFDLFIGKVTPVPKWWMKLTNQEGLYRVFQDPKKLKRQIKELRFLYLYYRRKL